MLPLLISILLQTDSLANIQRQDTDTMRTDTLREVTVRAQKELGVVKAFDGWRQQNPVPHIQSFGDVLEKLSPGINDKITHPFAFKQRRKERRHKRLMKALEDYDQIDSFGDMLREAYEQQMEEDALELKRREERE